MFKCLPLIISLIFCKVSFAQVKETVINETFTSNYAGWPEDITKVYSASVNGGIYYIEHFLSVGSKTFDIPTKLYLGTNYFIETEAKIISGDNNNGIGIVWGKGPGGFFSFVVTSEGKYYIRKKTQGSQGEYLVYPTASKAIYPKGKTNKFRVQYSEGELMFFINGKYITHLPVEKYFGDNAGVILYGKQKAEVYKFGIYGTKNYEILPDYKAKLRVASYEIDDNTGINSDVFGNGDCRIQPGETVKLAITLRNQSYGQCANLRAVFYAISDYVKIVSPNKDLILNNIERYQSQILELTFKVSQACNLENLKFKIDITDEKDRLGESITFNVPTNSLIPPINRDEAGKISFTINLREDNSQDINSFFPITLNNARNVCAVVIGIENYLNLPKAVYANNDAKAVYNYLVKVINVPRQNIIYLTNQNANLQRLKSVFSMAGELHSKVLSGAENIIVYFSGLGMCPYAKTTPYLMMFESESESPQNTGYSLSNMIKDIKALEPRTLICMFETTFAGLDRFGNSFVNKGGTVWSNAHFPVVSDNSTCLLYASGGQQYNPVVEATSHGMFTHYLLTAIQTFGKNRITLDMKVLYDFIYQRMDKESVKKGISVFPRIDCNNKDGIKLLK